MNFVIVQIDGVEVLVDRQDEHLIGMCKWRVSERRSNFYVCASVKKNGRTTTIYLHRVIMNAKSGDIVDHRSGDTFDNRRENLRFATTTQSATNCRKISARETSCRFRGVDLSRGKWRARIRSGGRHIDLGRFNDPVEAAYIYDLASLQMHGEFGHRNFLPLMI